LVHLGGDPDFLQDLDLIIMDDLHMLDEAYEMAIMRTMMALSYSTTRIIGLSAALQDAHSLAEWLKITTTGVYTFRPTVRALPLVTTVQPYSIAHSAILLKAMVKPVYAAIKAGLPKSSIVFVPSRMVCKSVANDLVTQSGMALDLNGFLAAPRQELEGNLKRMKDSSLIEPLLHGIGIYHEGMHHKDLALTLSLFAAGIARVLIVPRESCWTLPIQSGSVIVMGAQYLELESSVILGHPPERRLKNYSLVELIRMQGFATKPLGGSVADEGPVGGRFTLMCQSEQSDTYQRFLTDGLPLESKLASVLKMSSDQQVQATLAELLGEEPKRQDLMDLVSWSYLWVRMRQNPNFYDVEDEDLARRYLSRMVDGYFEEFHKRKRRGGGRQAVLDHLAVEGGRGSEPQDRPANAQSGKHQEDEELEDDEPERAIETDQGADGDVEDTATERE
jgi:antiviral helicase SLH1